MNPAEPFPTSEYREAIGDHLTRTRERRIQELAEFIRIPSVSKAAPGDEDMARAAGFVATLGAAAGADVEVLETEGHPATLLEWKADGADATVLFYAHLDVQPADDAGFEPVVHNGRIYGRGATDMKGPLLATINAIGAIRELAPELSLNVKLLAEGEEEIGSPSLRPLLAAHRDRLAADVAVISDTMMWGIDQPSICIGLRGWLGLELTVLVAPPEIAGSGLHSGDFGGVAPNALHVLADLVASLHDSQGRISVDGFYDDVPAINDEDRVVLAALAGGEGALREQLGARELPGEAGFTAQERISCRPTVEVVSLWGGYAGPGIKNAVPRRAQASLSCRLVGSQRPVRAAQLLLRHLHDRCPDYADLEVTEHPGTPPIRLPTDDPFLVIASSALEQVYGVPPLLQLSGASGTAPILLAQELGLPPILVGFSCPGENPHAADENFHLESFDRGTDVLARLLGEVASGR
jgi:acetylornithine deacetylase/succinyl-diaminopimelate desuccinylase-like protein